MAADDAALAAVPAEVLDQPPGDPPHNGV